MFAEPELVNNEHLKRISQMRGVVFFSDRMGFLFLQSRTDSKIFIENVTGWVFFVCKVEHPQAELFFSFSPVTVPSVRTPSSRSTVLSLARTMDSLPN